MIEENLLHPKIYNLIAIYSKSQLSNVGFFIYLLINC
jgi:hypothetical protein